MKNLKLEIKGSIGIYKGLGVDKITLDFSKLSGLIAIRGDNGSGKSTLLEMMHPYACLVSRKGALHHHFYLRDSYKDLEFDFHDKHYRSLIKIDSESNRTEGFLWEDGKPLVDGKISIYNKKVVELFGSTELFFNSAFCGQNSKKINELTTGKLQELFSEFLKLDRLIAFEGIAKEKKNQLAADKDRMGMERQQIREKLAGYNESEDTALETKRHKEELKARVETLLQQIEQHEKALAVSQTAIRENEVLKANASGIHDKIDQLDKSITKDKKQEKVEVETLREKYRAVDLEIMDAESLLANEAEIKQAADRVAEMSPAITDGEKQLEFLEDILHTASQSRSDKKLEVDKVSADSQVVAAEGHGRKKLLSQEIKNLEFDIGNLDKRDPACVSTTCSFIVNALGARADIPKVKVKLSNCVETYDSAEKTYNTLYKRLNSELSVLTKAQDDQEAERNTIKDQLAKLKADLVPIKKLANELPKVAEAGLRKTTAKKQRTAIATEGESIKKMWLERISDMESQKGQYVVDLGVAESKINNALDDDSDQIVETIRDARIAITGATTKIEQLAAKVAVTEKEAELRKQAVVELDAKTGEIFTITEELSDWAYLKTACGKDGLRALEIDSVAPIITAYANDLLLSSFGPAYTIRLDTQNDEGKEVMAIMVLCSDGSEVLLNNLSGGQKIWLLIALRLGMTLISGQKNGMYFETSFSDELDGPLDVERAVEFTKMYRAFMKAGNFESVFFITHKPECQSLADHVVSFGSGKVTIE